MKKIIAAIFSLAIAASTFGQEVDTVYTELRRGYNSITGDSAWYERTTTVFVNGVIDPEEILVGDTTALINRLFTQAEQVGRAFAAVANEVWQKEEKYANPIFQANALATTVLDTSIVEVGIDRYGPEQDSTMWAVYVDGDSVGIGLVRILNDNNLRLEIGAQNINMRPAGDSWLAIINYPRQGIRTDLFRLRGEGKLEFRSVDWIEGQAGIRIRKQ